MHVLHNAHAHIHTHLHMLVIAPKAIRSSTIHSRPPIENKSSTRKRVKCVTNETYYFLLKQRQISQSEFHVLVAFLCFVSTLPFFVTLHFSLLFPGFFLALDDERKHWHFFRLYYCSFDEKTFFAFVLFLWSACSVLLEYFSTFFATINSFRSQWFWHTRAHTQIPNEKL